LRIHLPQEVSRNTSPSHRVPRFRAKQLKRDMMV
jgi:hypothetical protein